MAEQSKRSEVQDIIWDIAKVILPVIRENRFRYYMLGGTLLGAVRHHGFIPWDDDIDIGMPRADYDRFLELISSLLPEHLELRTYWDDSPHHYYFARIVDTRHEFARRGSMTERNEDVWVDIFPLDGMPDNAVLRRIHMWRILYVRMRYHVACFDKVNLKRPNRPLSERLVIRFVELTGAGTRSDYRKWLDRIDRLLRKYSTDSTGWVSNSMGQYKFREMFPKAWYGDGALYDFEDEKLMGPAEYDKVLRQMYGDYMTPPQNKNVHASEFIK